MAAYLADLIISGILSFKNALAPFERGQHFPLVFLCLQRLEQLKGSDFLSEHVTGEKMDLLKWFSGESIVHFPTHTLFSFTPFSSSLFLCGLGCSFCVEKDLKLGAEHIVSTLNTYGLTYLCPSYRLQAQMGKLLEESANPAEVDGFLQENGVALFSNQHDFVYNVMLRYRSSVLKKTMKCILPKSINTILVPETKLADVINTSFYRKVMFNTEYSRNFKCISVSL